MRATSDPVTIVSAVALVVIVSLLLRNVVAGLVRTATADDEFEELGNEVIGSLRGIDLTSPQIKELAVLATGLPGFARLCKELPLEDLYRLMNRYYQAVTEVADRHRGEVSHMVGEEIVIVFGRILPVEDPLRAALDTAVQIARTLTRDTLAAGSAATEFHGVCAAVTLGSSISGPVGADLRKTWASFGPAPWLAIKLARAGSPGAVLIPSSLAGRVGAPFEVSAVEGLDVDGPVSTIAQSRQSTP